MKNLFLLEKNVPEDTAYLSFELEMNINTLFNIVTEEAYDEALWLLNDPQENWHELSGH